MAEDPEEVRDWCERLGLDIHREGEAWRATAPGLKIAYHSGELWFDIEHPRSRVTARSPSFRTTTARLILEGDNGDALVEIRGRR